MSYTSLKTFYVIFGAYFRSTSNNKINEAQCFLLTFGILTLILKVSPPHGLFSGVV